MENNYRISQPEIVKTNHDEGTRTVHVLRSFLRLSRRKWLGIGLPAAVGVALVVKRILNYQEDAVSSEPRLTWMILLPGEAVEFAYLDETVTSSDF